MTINDFMSLRDEYIENARSKIVELERELNALKRQSEFQDDSDSDFSELVLAIKQSISRITGVLKKFEFLPMDPWAWTTLIDEIEEIWIGINRRLNQVRELALPETGIDNFSKNRSEKREDLFKGKEQYYAAQY